MKCQEYVKVVCTKILAKWLGRIQLRVQDLFWVLIVAVFESARKFWMVGLLYRVRQWIGRFCNTVFFLVWQHWGGCRYRHFAANFKTFYKNGGSFVIIQCEFWREFGIHRDRAVPSAHAIKTWVRNFEDTGSTLKKEGGSVKAVCTPENIVVVRDTIERSPQNGVDFFQWSLLLPQYSRVYVLLLRHHLSSLV